jgi:hypothetical protein
MANQKGFQRTQKQIETLAKYNLRNKSEAERKEIAMKSVETRRKNRQRKMDLQQCMKTLLNLRISSDKQKQALKQIGFEDEELTNKTLLMTALFKKGISGNVEAIKEIVDMMDKLDLFEDTGKVTGDVTINLIPIGSNSTSSEDDSWDEEENEDDDDWGNEIYIGEQ